MNAALALIEGAAPRDEIEGAIAVQMACTHSAALSVLARFRGGSGSEARVVALATAAARLLRAYSVQVETLRRLRHGGDQHVRVESLAMPPIERIPFPKLRRLLQSLPEIATLPEKPPKPHKLIPSQVPTKQSTGKLSPRSSLA
jgi:hypothetical protein